MKQFLIITFLFISCNIFAQDFNKIFTTDKQILEKDSNSLYLRIENTNFFKNNEYFSKLEDGYTCLGTLLKPKLLFNPSGKTKIEAGLHLLKYYGQEKINQIYPIFTFQTNIIKGFDVLLGTLYSGMNHDLIEPLYKQERHFENNYENGIQLLSSYRNFKSDVWLNWEKFIQPGDPFKEEFTVGTNTRFFITDTSSVFIFSIPVQAVITHKGGQIDSAKNEPLESLINSAAGVSFKHNLKTDFVNSWGLNLMYVSANDISHTKLQPYISGYGIFSETWVCTKYFNLLAGYWDGNFFFAPRGETLFTSVSEKTNGGLLPHNQMAFGKIGIKKQIHKDIAVEARFEGYYEISEQNFDYSYGLHITFNRNFFMKKIK